MGKKINSKAKGNRNELEVAKILSERFNRVFKRAPQSGAWGTSNKESGVRDDALEILSGDLICPKDFKFAVEVKSRTEWNFWDMLNESTQHLEINDWLFQVEEDAKINNRIPLLYIKINNKKPFVLFPKELYEGKITYDGYTVMRFDYFLQLEDSFFFFDDENEQKE